MMNSSTIFDLDLSAYELHSYQENGKTVVVYLCILMALGIVGNGHVLLVYGRAGIKLNYQIFVMALAINDVLACTIIIPHDILYTRYSLTHRRDGACKVFRFFRLSLELTSVLLFALTGLERYRRICTPFKEQLTRKTVLIACCTVPGISCMASIPSLVLTGIIRTEMTESPYLNGTKCGYSRNAFYYAYFGIFLVIGTIIYIFLVAAYLKIARILLRQRHFSLMASSNENVLNQNSDSRKFKQTSTAIRNTISLMCVVVFSYLGFIPTVTFDLIEFAFWNIYVNAMENLGKAGFNILRRGYLINNVVNPFVYIIVDTQFRKGIRNTYVAMWRFLREVLISK